MNTKNYVYAFVLGFYPYVLLQAQALVRFGKINTSLNYLDIFPIVVGIVSVLILFFLMNKVSKSRAILISFLIAAPFSFMGMLMGGLLGAFGILIYGLIPFFIALPIGYKISK